MAKKNKECEVFLGETHLGTIIEWGGITSFCYFGDFLANGFDLGSRSMPRRPGVLNFDDPAFHRLPPLFADSLPDSYGQSVMRLWFEKNHGQDYVITPLDRLCYVGETGLGALIYRPGEQYPTKVRRNLDLHLQQKLARARHAAPEGEFIQRMRRAVRTLGGAYPKILAVRDPATDKYYEDDVRLPKEWERWIIKLSSPRSQPTDSLNNHGAIEYVYSLVAKECGLEIPEVKLLPGGVQHHSGLFAIRRFDFIEGERLHFSSFAGLRGVAPKEMTFDYRNAFALINEVTRSQVQTKEMFRRMVWNVYAGNADDHTKNHALLRRGGAWQLSPGYDLSFTDDFQYNSPSERAMAVSGEKTRIGHEHLISEGKAAGLTPQFCRSVLRDVAHAVSTIPRHLQDLGLEEDIVRKVSSKIRACCSDAKIPASKGAVPPKRGKRSL